MTTLWKVEHEFYFNHRNMAISLVSIDEKQCRCTGAFWEVCSCKKSLNSTLNEKPIFMASTLHKTKSSVAGSEAKART